MTHLSSRLLLVNLILLFWLWPTVAEAQSQIAVEVSETEVTLGQQVTMTVTVVGKKRLISLPDLTDMADFEEVGRTTSQQVRIVNGEMTSVHLFIYQLVPKRAGHLRIEPIVIPFDSGDMTTYPVEIIVKPADETSTEEEITPQHDVPLNVPYFVEAEVDKTDPYFGEQVIYTFRLYRTMRYYNEPNYEDPAFTNFWNQTIIDQPHYRLALNGQTYFVEEVRTAIFPAALGLITIDPARLVFPGLLQPDEIYETEVLTVAVRSLPADAPDSFKGAVGQYTIQSYLSHATGQVDEPLSWFIDIEGYGNIDVLNEPQWPELDAWRMFDSQAKTITKPKQAGVYGIRRFERLMIPTQSGQYTIPSVTFTYFDPETEQYETIQTEPVPIVIEPADTSSHENAMFPTLPEERPPLQPLKPVPDTLRSTSVNLFTQPIYWLCWFLPMLLVGVGWLGKRYYRYHKRQRKSPTQKAYQQAMAILHTSAGRDLSHQQAQKALLLYLSLKFNQPLHGLSKDTLKELYPNTPNDMVERYHDLINRIEISRYAPGGADYGETLLVDTSELIEYINSVYRE